MTLSIGRFGHTTHGGVPQALVDVDTMEHTGSTISITGTFWAPTQAEALVMRQQLLGHATNPDEQVVPVIWSEDTSRNGFYRVLAAQVSTGPVSLTTQQWPFTAQLQALVGAGNAMFESAFVAFQRVNIAGVNLPQIPFGLPSGSEKEAAIALGGGAALAAARSRPIDGGSVSVWWDAVAGGGITGPAAAIRWYVPVSDFYIGACRFEWNYGGSGTTPGAYWLPLVGNQIPDGDYALSPSPQWRLSNGGVRVSVDPAAINLIKVEWWNGSAWVAKSFKLRTDVFSSAYAAAVDIVRWHRPRVLRSAPEAATIRIIGELAYSSTQHTPCYLDLTVRRGGRSVELTFSHGVAGWDRIETSPLAGGGALTGGGFGNVGLMASVATSSVKWVIATAPAAILNAGGHVTINTVAAQQVSSWMIGGEILGVDTNPFTAGVDNTCADGRSLVWQWLYATSERMQVLAR